MKKWLMIIPLFVTSVTNNSVKTECVIIGISLVGFESLLMKYATYNTRFQRFSQLYFTICLAIIITYSLKHWEIAKEIFHAFQIMKKPPFLSRNRSSLNN